MKICLVGSILRHTIESDAGTYSGWGGQTQSAIAPLAALLDTNSTVRFVGSVGKEDIDEVKIFFKTYYPIVDTSAIHINPTGTDHHEGTKHFVKRRVQVEPTTFTHIAPHTQGADAVMFNFGNIDDIDPGAIREVKERFNSFVYVDVHRKPFGADGDGHLFARGWQGWENYLKYADVVQMDKNECEALFDMKLRTLADAAGCGQKILDAGAGQAIITLGGKGALLAHRTLSSYAFVHVPAIPTNVRDTTGCGDAFAAGYVIARHEGKPLLETVKWGTLMASLNCEFVGYMRGVTRQAIEVRIPADFAVRIVDPRGADALAMKI